MMKPIRATASYSAHYCIIFCGLNNAVLVKPYHGLYLLVWVASFEDGLKLVKLRGQAMQAAADAQPSAMVSVIGLDAEKVS